MKLYEVICRHLIKSYQKLWDGVPGFISYFPGHTMPHKWENCMTIDSGTWGYRRNADLSTYLSPAQLITVLVETVRSVYEIPCSAWIEHGIVNLISIYSAVYVHQVKIYMTFYHKRSYHINTDRADWSPSW